ncbi:hypothetical protein O9993_07425 [Vibrio lentus]|nr:hypothetical protein [Vibrio lentus]
MTATKLECWEQSMSNHPPYNHQPTHSIYQKQCNSPTYHYIKRMGENCSAKTQTREEIMPLIDNKHSRCIAAIDLGSNSTSIWWCPVMFDRLQLVSRHKQKVRLGDGFWTRT